MRVLWFCSFLLLAGCDWALDALKPEPTKTDLSEAVNLIPFECATPPEWLRPVGTNTLAIKADSKAREKELECIVEKVRNYPFKVKLAFIGNEAILENAQ